MARAFTLLLVQVQTITTARYVVRPRLGCSIESPPRCLVYHHTRGTSRYNSRTPLLTASRYALQI